MTVSNERDEMIKLVHEHASFLGYYDGKIDLSKDINDFSSVYESNCTLTANAPLWGTEVGEEKPVPIDEVRKTLQGMLRFMTPDRHDMHLAINDAPNDESGTKQLCLYFVVKMKIKVMPCFYAMKVPLLFLVSFTESSSADGQLRISEINEWPADSPESGEKLLTERLGWPTAKFEKYENFGAAS
mmetsp:Transcript_22351/g.40338  ORF Transcript_22351/g.40338 Transcript_22351/m.40338 type:complete len:185 (-) Transcript_22351:220-774(-)